MMKMVLKEHQILLMNFDAWNNTNTSKVYPIETEFNYSNYQVINLYSWYSSSRVRSKFKIWEENRGLNWEIKRK